MKYIIIMVKITLPSGLSIKSVEMSDSSQTALQLAVDFFKSKNITFHFKSPFLSCKLLAVKQPLVKLIKMWEMAASEAGKAGEGPLGFFDTDVSTLVESEWQFANPQVEDAIQFSMSPDACRFIAPYIRWSSTSTGDPVFLVRITDVASCWEVSSDPGCSLALHIHSSGKTYMDYLSEQLLEKQKAGEINWGVKSTTDPETGTIQRIFQPLMSIITEPSFKEAIKKEKSLYLKLPTTFSNDPTVPSSCYFPINSLPTSPTPDQYEAWTDFESQMPPWAIPMWRAAFYGIFDAENRSRQIIIFYDDGQTGKSNLVRALTNISTGNFYASLSKNSLDNQFWGSKILGRRLILFSDSGNQKIPRMDKVKQLSGGDPVDVELKGISGQIHYTPNCRVIVTTNSRPEINTYNEHQISRVLIFPLTATQDENIRKKFCKLNPDGTVYHDPETGKVCHIGAPYDVWMTEQFYPYLSACKSFYEELCPKKQDIIVCKEMLDYIEETCVSSSTDALMHMMENFLELHPDGRISNGDLKILVDHIAGSMRDPDLTFEIACEYLLLQKCKRKPCRIKNTVLRAITGVRFREGYSIYNDRVTYRPFEGGRVILGQGSTGIQVIQGGNPPLTVIL